MDDLRVLEPESKTLQEQIKYKGPSLENSL